MDDRELNHGVEVERQFLEACGDAPALFQPAHALFDHRATSIGCVIESHSAVVVRPFVGAMRNHRPHAAPAQPRAETGLAVGLISGQGFGSSARRSQRLRNGDAVEQRLDARGFVALTSGDLGDQRRASAVSNHMDFGAKPASAAAQRVIGLLAGVAVFFRAPAAARVARMFVLSTHHSFQSMRP